ncbi:MAG TPA: BON domain-containing protein [Candidatus Dormibacteraeota bacterium]|nr:BON domain-containing protein [Candidatus Dormibacteraeota bacterium]
MPPERVSDDAAIARAVEVALRSSPYVPEGVTADVADGHVTLGGEVAWEYERQEAERVVRAAVGMRPISNLIRLRVAPPGELLPPHHRLRRRADGWVAREDVLAECERYYEGLMLQVREAETARLREFAANLARDLVLERWDPEQDRWLPVRDPTIERMREEQGLGR